MASLRFAGVSSQARRTHSQSGVCTWWNNKYLGVLAKRSNISFSDVSALVGSRLGKGHVPRNSAEVRYLVVAWRSGADVSKQ